MVACHPLVPAPRTQSTWMSHLSVSACLSGQPREGWGGAAGAHMCPRGQNHTPGDEGRNTSTGNAVGVQGNPGRQTDGLARGCGPLRPRSGAARL